MIRKTTAIPPGTDLPAIVLPPRYGYIAAFLTMACNLRCSYCINWFRDPRAGGAGMMDGADWARGLNRILSRPDRPITLQGGEPSLHPGFYDLLAHLREDITIDLLTNLQFDVEEFMARVPPGRIRRDAPYASIRVSYHPETMDLDETRGKVLRLLERGYSVGIWAVRHPGQIKEIESAAARCGADGIDFRFKDFLGEYQGCLHGQYKYPEAVSGTVGPPVTCRTSELLIAPSGHVYRCHSDLYASRTPIGHLLDEAFDVQDIFRPCEAYGLCNPCDIKVKTNRFQQFGHTSVEIRTLEGNGRSGI